MPRRERGLYEIIVTERLDQELMQLSETLEARRSPLRDADAADRIALHIATVIQRAVSDSDAPAQFAASLARRLIDVISEAANNNDIGADRPLASSEVLRAVVGRLPDGKAESISSPRTPLLDTTLLTNAPGEPRVGHEILEEIASADRIDACVAFIRHSGIAPMLKALRAHCAAGRKLRLLTTTYTHSTEPRALDALRDLGAEIRVSYDMTNTRLHAKAWLFHHASGFSTGYIGSSNLTHSAQVTGLEWNVRVSNARNPVVIEKVAAVFASYWEGGDFVDYDPKEFLEHMQLDEDAEPRVLLSPTELRPEPFQERLLEQIALARQQGHHCNLLVAATGTGKTVMAALDYASLRATLPRARLLFVAHRAEILEKSLATFRYALRDANFGELWVDGKRPKEFEHVFASIQSLHTKALENIDPTHFDVVIIDEFHHAAATSYQRLIEHLKPKELLGLTATPERSDGLPILHMFDNRIAGELRLWDAIDQHRLVPFAYYGIHDGLDLRDIPWRRGMGYDIEKLSNLMTSSDAWARLVVQELSKHADDLKRMRALGFCVSVEHARFMARIFNAAGIASTAVWSDTPEEERKKALSDLDALKINVVFSVDLFNEGVDVPSVDMLLMLRPTE
ncbi:MAG: DEAD/DEAH box helicase family protein, partial [Polyangiaceae bacterium]